MTKPPRRTELAAMRTDAGKVSEDSLTSTKLALRFLYQEALRNNHFAMAAILQETLDCCDRINVN